MPDIINLFIGVMGCLTLVWLVLLILLITASFSLPYTEDDEFFEN